MDPEYGLGSEVAEEIEECIRKVAAKHGLVNTAPWHDMAAWIVKELKKGGGKRGS